ncbi:MULTISPECIES: Csu type fimbrial protein [Halomonas]|nr:MULTISPECIES: spore coat U domain-containing protein [Halomonas]
MIKGWQLVSSAVMVAGLSQASPTDTFMVSATITPGCLINQEIPSNGTLLGMIGSLAFGTASALSQDMHSASLVTSSAFTLSCTPGTPLTLRVDGGQQWDVERQLKRVNGNETLAYQLYQDAALQNAIGISQPVSIDTSTTPDNITLPIWGRLMLPGNLPAGSYSDELLVTLEW